MRKYFFFEVGLISRAILGKQVMQSIYGQMYLYIIIDNKNKENHKAKIADVFLKSLLVIS